MDGKILPYTCFVLVVMRANCAPVRLVGCTEIRSHRLSYRLERSRQRTGANRLWRPVKANPFRQHPISKSLIKVAYKILLHNKKRKCIIELYVVITTLMEERINKNGENC